MKILLSNDDGVDAVGLKILEKIAVTVFPEANIFVYAPDKSISGAGRSMTFGSGKKVRVERRDNNHFCVYGTPTDCVEIACRLHKFDLVLTGVNHGWNLGQDFYLSGTVQQACHAVEYFNVPAIAFSSDKKALLDGRVDSHLEKILATLKEFGHRGGLISVNFPAHSFSETLIVGLGNYLAVGSLTPVCQEGSSDWFDLLEPMSKMEISDKAETTDVCRIMQGKIAVSLHLGADAPFPICVPW